jgi:Ca-activated chloride channel family protein
VAKTLMKDVIGGLRPGDFINVLLFAGGSAVLSEGHSLPATEANKNSAISWINSRQGGGGTRILPALQRALALPRTEGVSRIVVVVTDGYVSVEPQAFELIRGSLGEANLFTFGIGSSVNRFIIDGMARVGHGEPFVVLNGKEASRQAAKFRDYIRSPVLTDIEVTFHGLKVQDVEPLAVPDLFALRPLIVFGKYSGAPVGNVLINGRTAAGEFSKRIPIDTAMTSGDNAALRLLWARHRIVRLSDLNRLRPDDDRVKEVTSLGLKYHLMTQYTSFVAVDKVKRADGSIVTVKQPLPLPEGVSDLAVGDRLASRTVGKSLRAQSASPPGRWSLLRKPSSAASQSEANEESMSIAAADDKSARFSRVELVVEKIKGRMEKVAIERMLRAESKPLNACILNVQATGTGWSSTRTARSRRLK